MGQQKSKRQFKKPQVLAAGICAGLSLCLLLPACVQRQESAVTPDYVLTYAENQTKDYPTTQGAQYFADLVSKETGGKVEILVYPDAKLGDEVSTVEQCVLGGIDFTRVSLSTVTDKSAESNVLMLPFLYQDADHMWRVLDGDIGSDVMKTFDGTGITPLSWYDAGVRSFYTRTRASCLADLKGMKIRVQPSAEIPEQMVSLLGASTVKLDYSDVYSALQTGRIDGAENNWSSYEAMQHYEMAPYYLEDEHMRIPELQIMSTSTAQKLPDKYMDVIRECAKKSALHERELWTERETKAKERAVKAGCEAIPLSEEEKTKFRQAVQPLYDEYDASYGDLLARINALRDVSSTGE